MVRGNRSAQRLPQSRQAVHVGAWAALPSFQTAHAQTGTIAKPGLPAGAIKMWTLPPYSFVIDPKCQMRLSQFERCYRLMKWVSLRLPLRWNILIIKSITESLPRNNWVYYSPTPGFVSALKTVSLVINQNLKLLIPITNNMWSLEMANRRADTNLVPWDFINWTFVTLDLLEIRSNLSLPC